MRAGALSRRCGLRLFFSGAQAMPTPAHSVRYESTATPDANCKTRSIVYEVQRGGFPAKDLHGEPPSQLRPTSSWGSEGAKAWTAATNGENTLLLGPFGTGKLTLLKMIGEERERGNWRTVIYASQLPQRVMRMRGVPLNSYLGVRLNKDESPAVEQLETTLERHVRLMPDLYDDVFPTLANTDVLVLDSLQWMQPNLFKAMDAVARRVRNSEKPMGGIHVVAAADFFDMGAAPDSSHVGYLFQEALFDAVFPRANRVFLSEFHHHTSKQYSHLVHRAHAGRITRADITELEQMLTPDSVKRKDICPLTPVVDMSRAGFVLYPKFPKQLFVYEWPAKNRDVRKTEFGHYLTTILSLGVRSYNYGLPFNLSLAKGHIVMLTHTGMGLRRGALGVVKSVTPRHITVYFYVENRELDIPPLKIRTFHKDYPHIYYDVSQFPLLPRSMLHGEFVREHRVQSHLMLDATLLTDTNDLGNILAVCKGPGHTAVKPGSIGKYLRRDGMVHEAVAVFLSDHYPPYMRAWLDAGHKDTKEKWCKNCKKHVAVGEFMNHWNQCIQEVRWCAKCNDTVPVEKWEPHKEKHTMVMCIDCAKSLEWREWDAHRLECVSMLRELSIQNEFLPSITRQAAMQHGFDTKDLHTVKKIVKSNLPNLAPKPKRVRPASSTDKRRLRGQASK